MCVCVCCARVTTRCVCVCCADLMLFGNGNRSATPIGAAPERGSGDEGPRFLDTYSEGDLRSFFEDFRLPAGRYKGWNYNEVFRALGFTDLVFDIDVSDNFVHKVQLYAGARRPECLLAQLFIRRETTFSVLETKQFDAHRCGVPQFYAEGFDAGLAYLRTYFTAAQPARRGAATPLQQRYPHLLQMIVIEWLRFQNPRAAWPRDALPLPGQLHPGLGTVNDMQLLLKMLCLRKQRDGVMNIPEHWYNAYLYSRLQWPYLFLNPAFQGFFLSTCIALEPDIARFGFSRVAWAVDLGRLRCADGAGGGALSHITWVAQEQVAPVTQKLLDYFDSDGYKEIVRSFTRPELFSIDWSDLSDSLPPPPSSSL